MNPLNSVLRPTWAEVKLKNIKYNADLIKKLVGPNVDILAVVKADAYGHGAIEVAKVLQTTSVKMLGVATVEEGIKLRKAGIKKSILILGSTFPFKNFQTVIHYNLIPTIASISGLVALNNYAKTVNKNKKIAFHLKVDTGMGRIGLLPATAIDLVKKISNSKNIYLDGVYSHLACTVENRKFTEQQLALFKKLAKKIPARYYHIAASAAILKYKNSYLPPFNMVRPGLLIYGLLPFKNSEKFISTKPVLSLKTKIVFLKTVPPKTSISYCRTFFTKKNSKIATIPIGYADGFLRANSNNAEVLVRNRKVPVVGNVCMDMTMLDVTAVKNVAVGDEVVIIGTQGTKKISAEDIARKCNTINYEILTSISQRVPRVYI